MTDDEDFFAVYGFVEGSTPDHVKRTLESIGFTFIRVINPDQVSRTRLVFRHDHPRVPVVYMTVTIEDTLEEPGDVDSYQAGYRAAVAAIREEVVAGMMGDDERDPERFDALEAVKGA